MKYNLGELEVITFKRTNAIHIGKESSLILAIECDVLLKFLKKEIYSVYQYTHRLFWSEDDNIIYSNTYKKLGLNVKATKKEIDELIEAITIKLLLG
tara:strand:+ start:20333 stop:20623 length:291 start_codon:yes stop_codon:yes gene_type:complete